MVPFRERGSEAQARRRRRRPRRCSSSRARRWTASSPTSSSSPGGSRFRKRRRVVFEAAGRNLADLRLWQNGSWLVDAAPVVSVIEPQSGRPLALCQLTADLAPGPLPALRLRRTGGRRGRAGAVERPFHLRFGWPRDAQTLRERRTIGPFGFDRVLVSGAADYFRLELPEPLASDGDEAALEVATLEAGGAVRQRGRAAILTKENVPPVGGGPDRRRRRTADRGHGPRRRRPAVRSAAFRAHPRARAECRAAAARSTGSRPCTPVRREMRSSRPRSWSATATARSGRARSWPARRSTLTGVAGWARRFNLLDTASLYVKVEAGRHLRPPVARHRGAVPPRAVVPRRLSRGLANAADAQRAGRVAARSGLLRPDRCSRSRAASPRSRSPPRERRRWRSSRRGRRSSWAW